MEWKEKERNYVVERIRKENERKGNEGKRGREGGETLELKEKERNTIDGTIEWKAKVND